MEQTIGIADAFDSPLLCEPFFRGPSWNLWRTVLKATFAEPMDDAEIAAFRVVADRAPPKHRVSTAVYAVGRGGGKDSVTSLIATLAAINFDPRGKLRPGERAVVMCIACDRQQARIVLSYIAAYFELIPALAAMVVSIGDDCIELNNRVVIEVHTNSYRSVRGRSIICAIFDEIAFWRDEHFATPDIEVHAAVSPGLARLPGSMLVLISSAHKRSGLLYQMWKDFYGREDDDVLVVRGSTLLFNPTFDASVVAKALERDPQLYGAEYNCEWRDDLAQYISRELIEAAVDRGVVVRPPVPGTTYIAFCDGSGGVHDWFTAALAHSEGEKAVLDLLYERKPPFNPSEVVAEISTILKSHHVTKITGDRYSAGWIVEAFAKVGIRYEQSKRDRSQVYLDAIPLFTSGCARLIDSPRLVSQFAALERRTFSTGRDRVDHPKNSGGDDSCNSAAGALTLAASKRGPMQISDRVLERASQPAAFVDRNNRSAPVFVR